MILLIPSFQEALFCMALLCIFLFTWWVTVLQPRTEGFNKEGDSYMDHHGDKHPMHTHAQIVAFLVCLAIWPLRFVLRFYLYAAFFLILNGAYFTMICLYSTSEQAGSGALVPICTCTSWGTELIDVSNSRVGMRGSRSKRSSYMHMYNDEDDADDEDTIIEQMHGSPLIGESRYRSAADPSMYAFSDYYGTPGLRGWDTPGSSRYATEICTMSKINACISGRRRYGHFTTDLMPEPTRTLFVAVLVLVLGYTLEVGLSDAGCWTAVQRFS